MREGLGLTDTLYTTGLPLQSPLKVGVTVYNTVKTESVLLVSVSLMLPVPLVEWPLRLGTESEVQA